MKPTESFKEAIKKYLDERAGTDELFAVSYAKENKNIDECCSYIMGEALKASADIGSGVKGCGMDNDDVFNLAVHYYDEDNIKINKVSGGTRVLTPAAKVELTEEDKKAAHDAAIKRLTEEQYQLLRKKPGKKKEVTEVQPSLFEF